MRNIGINDIPISSERNDMLSLRKQVSGVANFIRKCETPMTISIQGSWGAGKTSFINMVKNKINEDEKSADDIVFIYFNSWHFVQFDMSDQMGTSLIIALTKELSKGINDEKSKKTINNIFSGMEIIKATGKLGALLANAALKEKFSIDVKDYLDQAGLTDTEKILKQKTDSVTAIEVIDDLKKNLQKVINARLGISEGSTFSREELNRKRVVIFVDDLDRLAPDKAVEVLEILNMFLGCDHCVYLLAIDYEVVVNGVAAKYKNTIAEDKGHEYFEKLIQVVFRLPEKMNNTDHYIAKILGDSGCNRALANRFAELVRDCGQDNPRAIKRLMNSYILIEMMRRAEGENTISQDESIALFAVLCLQTKCIELYDYISKQFNRRFNYEKGVVWFNKLHQFCCENAFGYERKINISEDKLIQWRLVKKSSMKDDSLMLDKEKIVFLIKFFEAFVRRSSYKPALGEMLDIQCVIDIKNAIHWSDLLTDRHYSRSLLNYVTRIKVTYGGYLTRETDTQYGSIVEAYKLTVQSILKFILDRDGIAEHEELFANDDMEKLEVMQTEKLREKSGEEVFNETVRLFSYFLSDLPKNQADWEEIRINDRRLWIRVDFHTDNDSEEEEKMICMVKLLSNYLHVEFEWYAGINSEEPWVTGYKVKENIDIGEVYFVSIGKNVFHVLEHDFVYAYYMTVERLMDKMDEKKRNDAFNKYGDFIRLQRDGSNSADADYDFYDADALQGDFDGFDNIDDLDNFDSLNDFEDLNDFDSAENSVETDSTDDYAGDVFEEVFDDNDISFVNSYGDDLDKVSPWEYETETERRVRENKTIITEEEYYMMNKPVDGWREATIINEGQINFYINVNVEKQYMLMLVYKLSEMAGEKVTWYSSADMQKYIVFEKKKNAYMEYLKETELKDLYEKEPRVFREPYIAFGDLFNYIYLDE